MRSEFEKWFDQYENNNEYAAKKIAKDAYELGLQNRQTEVEELQKRVDATKRKLNEIAGIAKRARHGDYYTDSGRNAGLNIASELEQALKGVENE